MYIVPLMHTYVNLAVVALIYRFHHGTVGFVIRWLVQLLSHSYKPLNHFKIAIGLQVEPGSKQKKIVSLKFKWDTAANSNGELLSTEWIKNLKFVYHYFSCSDNLCLHFNFMCKLNNSLLTTQTFKLVETWQNVFI